MSTSIVLFYRYFLPQDFPLLHKYPEYYEEQLYKHQQKICVSLKGRILLSREGINGTLSGTTEEIETYIAAMKPFDLLEDCGVPDDSTHSTSYRLFADVDWKLSTSTVSIEPFPDLKISIVPEIISSGGLLKVDEIKEYGGKHLTPREFHRVLQDNANVVLLDIRNTFEHDIGHFVNPTTQEPAIQPNMTNFAALDCFCAQQAEELRDKKVLMYCTGGIRCEKASAMLKKRGVQDVNQLSGGIHRYLEEMGEEGFFKGRNFVFDQRVSVTPSECQRGDCKSDESQTTVVGKCVDCEAPFDEIDGSRVCTVCRDLVLVCPQCQPKHEYHCRNHAFLKDCYFTFLERFTEEELRSQLWRLDEIRNGLVHQKNLRKTISKQIDKISVRLLDLESNKTSTNPEAPRRCRTCYDSLEICDGRCWGFWKTRNQVEPAQPLEEISIDTRVVPGPHWNALRLGDPSKYSQGGVVKERKTWAASSPELDCVAVEWDGHPRTEIYRWGAVARNGQRLYDIMKLE